MSVYLGTRELSVSVLRTPWVFQGILYSQVSGLGTGRQWKNYVCKKNYAVWSLGLLRSRDYVVPVVATTKLQTTNYKKIWLAPTLNLLSDLVKKNFQLCSP